MYRILFIVLVIQLNLIKAENTTFYTTIKNKITNTKQFTTTIIENDDDDDVNVDTTPEVLSESFCETRDKPYFLPHKIDVKKFYVCVKGQLFLLDCPSNYQFDNEAQQCVHETKHDDIPQQPKTPVLIPHETNCGWYYVVREGTADERILNSCPMPQLFDITKLECKNYTEVKCKDRFEPKDACDYQIRSSAHAYPCSYLPSCKNRPDGLYPDRLRDCRMYFRCTSERTSESFSCTQNTLPSGERFSVDEQRCLPAQEVECTNDQQKPFV